MVSNSLKNFTPQTSIPPIKITLKPNYTPFKSLIVRRVPVNWDCAAKKLIDRLLENDIIALNIFS